PFSHFKVIMSQSGRDHATHPGQSQSTNHSPRRTTPPPPVTNVTNFLQNPEFIQGLSSLIARAMPRNSSTIPLSMPLTTNPTEHPTHTRNDHEPHVATSHATSQPHHTSPRQEEQPHVIVNPTTNNQVPDQPPVQEMTAESHSAHHQRVSPRPRPISSAPHAREDLRRQIERNRLSRHSVEEIETLRKRLAELEMRQKSQEDLPRHVATSGNVVVEADSSLAPELTAELLPVKVKIPQIGMYDGTSDPDAHLGHYTSWMDLHGASDALRCRMFSLTLGPRAQKWYYTLPPHSIWKWQQLRAAFRSHFIGAQTCLIPKESITNIVQKDDETVKDYVARFNDRIQNMEPCHPETLLVTAIAGLRPNSMFRWTL
ncbi:Unknown protein, partial [Striga hermonthica]